MFDIITKQCLDEEGAEYIGYGIRCGEVLIHNIAKDLHSVSELVHRLEEGCFSQEHLEDVVEDWLAESSALEE